MLSLCSLFFKHLAHSTFMISDYLTRTPILVYQMMTSSTNPTKPQFISSLKAFSNMKSIISMHFKKLLQLHHLDFTTLCCIPFTSHKAFQSWLGKKLQTTFAGFPFSNIHSSLSYIEKEVNIKAFW